MSRPRIVDKTTLEKLESAFLMGCSDVEACFAADISPATLYNYQKENPQFLERKETLKANPIYVARMSVLNGMRDNGDLALKFLERKKKDEFSTRTENNIGGQSDGVPVDVNLKLEFVKPNG